MTTIRDVAQHAGVSISTVSRVVNQSTPVDPITTERVREAIVALNYRPNLLARSFRRRVTHTIGLVVPDNSNPFFAELARVIEDEGFAAGYSVILCNSDLSELKQATYVEALIAKRVDGIVIVSSGLVPTGSGPDVMQSILAANVPCVAVDRDLGEMPVDQVLVDNEQGGALAADYLLGLGHRRFAYVAGPSELTPSAGRIAGFRRRLERFGNEVAFVRALPGDGRHDGGVQAARSLLDHGLDVTAAFVFNDLTAVGMIGALHRNGCHVPADLSVVGFDDIPQAGTGIPALTTVAQPVCEMGKASVRLLLDRIARPDAPYQRLVLPTELIERESCRSLFESVPEGPQSTPAGLTTRSGAAESLSAVAMADPG
jgi:LacI family transcriptional regulator